MSPILGGRGIFGVSALMYAKRKVSPLGEALPSKVANDSDAGTEWPKDIFRGAGGSGAAIKGMGPLKVFIFPHTTDSPPQSFRSVLTAKRVEGNNRL
jgi:hypothetical protein